MVSLHKLNIKPGDLVANQFGAICQVIDFPRTMGIRGRLGTCVPAIHIKSGQYQQIKARNVSKVSV